ncbi:MAG: porin [Vicinamibacteria bacterium]
MRFSRPCALMLALFLGSVTTQADDYQLGAENFLYRSTSTLLNRDNVFGLAPTENLFRLTGSLTKTRGSFSAKVSAFGEQQTGKTDEARLTFRQAFVEYKTDDGFLVRVGKQKTAWGSGFVWNPTSRLEPPKSPANPGTEQPGIDAARLDISPSGWASITMIAGRAQTALTDLPGSLARETDPEWTGALRARLLVRDTDIALTYVAGTTRQGLFGVDLGRALGPVALHMESAIYKGSEIDRARPDDRFVRVVAGALWSPGDFTVSAEYFFNGEGMNGAQFGDYTARLDHNLTAANDARLPPQARAASLAAWSVDAAIPFSSNLGLRRHYASVALTRSEVLTNLTANLRAVAGLSDRGVILTPGVAYAPTGHVQMNLDVVLLFGPESAEYKLAPIKRAVQARMKYSF